MSTWRSKFAVAVLSSAALTGGFFGGAMLLDKVDFAKAESQVELSRQQLEHVEDLSSVFREVNKVVEPSVVNIEVARTVHMQHPDIDENLLRRFFNDNGQDAPNLPNQDSPNQQDFEQDDTGSGVIMEVADGYGYILTNNHVAGGASDITITLTDGRVIKHAHLMGADAKTDLAVVRIKSDDLIAAHWGNSDELQQGDWVLAFGSPLGYAGSMTHGIVSALNRSDIGIVDGGNGYENFIQVDAPINPGNSGGPLVNLHGEVVGINAAIASRTGTFSGIGFAIPSNQAHKVYDMLKSGHQIVRGWLGVGISSVSDQPKVAASFGYDGKTGVLVREIFPDTPAYDRLNKGDIITEYNGVTMNDRDQLRNAVAATEPGKQAKLKVFRDGSYITVTLTIGSQPEDLASVRPNGEGAEPQPQQVPPDDHASSDLGLQLQTLTNSVARELNLDAGTKGAVITNVKHGSLADQAGLRPGMVIQQVGRTVVNNSREANDALGKADVKKGVRLTVLTSDGSDFVVLQQEDDGSSQN